jgi:hypothetical protein
MVRSTTSAVGAKASGIGHCASTVQPMPAQMFHQLDALVVGRMNHLNAKTTKIP